MNQLRYFIAYYAARYVVKTRIINEHKNEDEVHGKRQGV
jgi:hypothetical protein